MYVVGLNHGTINVGIPNIKTDAVVVSAMQLIKALEAARGNGTSMISLIMPPRDQVSRVQKMLGDEFGTASNIKNRVNRQVRELFP